MDFSGGICSVIVVRIGIYRFDVERHKMSSLFVITYKQCQGGHRWQKPENVRE